MHVVVISACSRVLLLGQDDIRLCDMEVDNGTSTVTTECRCETTYLL